MKSIVRLSVLAVMFLAFAGSATAQQTSNNNDRDYVGRRVLINKWYQNWEVSARVGTQAYLGEYVHCAPYFNIKQWWNVPAIDISMSKWGTQSIGLAIGFTTSPFKSLYNTREGSNEPYYASFAKPETDEVYCTGFNIARGQMGNAYVSAIFDINNLIWGTDKNRIFHVVASIGGGIMFPMGDTRYRDICSSFNAGLINKFQLSDHFSFDIAIRGTLHDDMFNGISYYTSDDQDNLSVDATIGATAGISYKFDMPRNKEKAAAKEKKNREGWTTVDEVVAQTNSYKEIEQAAKQAEEKAAQAESELAVANAKIEALEKGSNVVVVKEPVKYRQLVNFVIDRWGISNREKINVLFASEFIKEHPDTKFNIMGYADKQTANPKHNQMLSEKRCEAVYNMLVNEFGVNPEQLEITANGGVDYMFFGDKQCSRSVEIYAVGDTVIRR